MEENKNNFYNYKVIIITASYPSERDPLKGIFIKREVESLKKFGLDIYVLCPTPYSPKTAFRKFTNENKKLFFPKYFKLPGNLFLKYLGFQFENVCKRFIQKNLNYLNKFIIHAHHGFISGFVGTKLKKYFSVPLVVTYRGSDINTYLAEKKNGWKLCAEALRKSDVNIFVSKALYEIAKDIVPDLAESYIIPTGVSLPFFDENENVKEERQIIFIGRLEEWKGIFDLLEAFRLIVNKYPVTTLCLIGPDESKGKVQKFIKEIGIQKNVLLKGILDENEVLEELRKSIIFCLPSYLEGMPNSMKEAMACGLPVIVSNVGGMPEVIKNGENGFLHNVGDVEAIAGCIKILLENEKLRKEMGIKARETALKYFHPEENAKKIALIYENLIRKYYGNNLSKNK